LLDLQKSVSKTTKNKLEKKKRNVSIEDGDDDNQSLTEEQPLTEEQRNNFVRMLMCNPHMLPVLQVVEPTLAQYAISQLLSSRRVSIQFNGTSRDGFVRTDEPVPVSIIPLLN
jgi:adenylylsulfate kinase-like enzyme